MRLAHLVIVLPVATVLPTLEGCGGSSADSVADAPDAAVFFPDAARDVNIPLAGGWRSFTVSFATEAVTFKSSAPASALPVLMAGARMRLDFDNGAFRANHLAGAALIADFADPVGFGGTATYPLIMQADRALGAALIVHRVTPSGTIDLRFDSLLFDLDAHALPLGGVARGSVYVYGPRGNEYGEVTASFTATMDAEAPRWRATGNASFAPMPLPWDVRTVETSEPYEGHVTPAQLFPEGTFETRPLVTPILWGSPPREREHGLTLLLRSWDDAATLTTAGASVRDLAGNASAMEPPLTLPGVGVPRLDAEVLDPSVTTLTDVTTWGSVGLEDCPDSSPGDRCFVVGPADVSPCTGASLAGLATRLRGQGSITFAVRAVAIAPGAVSLPSNLTYFASAIPGQSARIDGSTLRWPAKGVGGTFDTGWTTLTMPALGTSAETGVAVSLGGLGAAAERGSCSPPYHASVTLHVRRVAVSPEL